MTRRRPPFPLDPVADEFLARVPGEGDRIRLGDVFRQRDSAAQRWAKHIASTVRMSARTKEHAAAGRKRHERSRIETLAAHREITERIDAEIAATPGLSRRKAAPRVRRAIEEEHHDLLARLRRAARDMRRPMSADLARLAQLERMLKIKSSKAMAACRRDAQGDR